MPEITHGMCLYCGGCVGMCPKNAITLFETSIEVDDNCSECGLCILFCPAGALVYKKYDTHRNILSRIVDRPKGGGGSPPCNMT